MSSPFLVGFSRVVIQRLLDAEQVEIAAGGEERVVCFVAETLDAVPFGCSLISSLTRALVTCPEVDELYADDAALIELIEGIESNPRQWTAG